MHNSDHVNDTIRGRRRAHSVVEWHYVTQTALKKIHQFSVHHWWWTICCCCVWGCTVHCLSEDTAVRNVAMATTIYGGQPLCWLQTVRNQRNHQNKAPVGDIQQASFFSQHIAQHGRLCQSQTRDARPEQLWQFLDDIRPENEGFHLAVFSFLWTLRRMQNL